MLHWWPFALEAAWEEVVSALDSDSAEVFRGNHLFQVSKSASDDFWVQFQFFRKFIFFHPFPHCQSLQKNGS